MAITVKQWSKATGTITRVYIRAVLAAMKAGNNIANRRAKFTYILDRSGPPLPTRLTNRSGRLRASIKMVEPHYKGKTYIMGLRSRLGYAAHETGIRGRKRPFMRPALRDALPETDK